MQIKLHCVNLGGDGNKAQGLHRDKTDKSMKYWDRDKSVVVFV